MVMARRVVQITIPTILASTLALVTPGVIDSAFAVSAKQNKTTAIKNTPATDTARRYAEAIAKGDRVTVGQLDFACQYQFVALSVG